MDRLRKSKLQKGLHSCVLTIYSFKHVHNPVVDFLLVSTPDGFAGARRNETPVIQECEVHWVVKKLKASVYNGDLTEEALETPQFKNHWPTPWDEVDWNWYRANFSMTLPDPHSVTGNFSEYRVENTSARRVWQGEFPHKHR